MACQFCRRQNTGVHGIGTAGIKAGKKRITGSGTGRAHGRGYREKDRRGQTGDRIDRTILHPVLQSHRTHDLFVVLEEQFAVGVEVVRKLGLAGITVTEIELALGDQRPSGTWTALAK